MPELALLDEQEIDALLVGRGPERAGEDLAPLTDLVRSVRLHFAVSPVDDVTSRRHVAELATETLALLPAPVPSETSPSRRRRVVAAVAGATLGTLAVTGGLAAADVLPETAQRAVADAGAVLGIDLPSPDDLSPVATDDGDDAEPGGDRAEPKNDGPGGDGTPTSDEASSHGRAVSDAARDHSTDEECGNHGAAVSAVARGADDCTTPPGLAGKDGSGDDPRAGEQSQDDGAPPAGKTDDHEPFGQPPGPPVSPPGQAGTAPGLTGPPSGGQGQAGAPGQQIGAPGDDADDRGGKAVPTG